MISEAGTAASEAEDHEYGTERDSARRMHCRVGTSEDLPSPSHKGAFVLRSSILLLSPLVLRGVKTLRLGDTHGRFQISHHCLSFAVPVNTNKDDQGSRTISRLFRVSYVSNARYE